ncbi:zinc ABC transporter substrate-binding protein [Nocardia implantans]|uniref:Zinc ABC transporter substrate-binding protein n=1 Tax=Nocardia implantans TaxID=3108168 RepID=A0ABU6B325_9NOCA|nr:MULTISPECIES: zinc ABC transporter substrate-binding protein [unclassified Nocardia]MBF6190378.1 zinc ABC transporter substrate-binding protein [Nocardia beijingensis]MEA3531906.1 zinc ABC transporter substrate-binding protein [Nocardia sp. CDC192]MEB3514070.1 zinc ABC transporter substrate-binding protein [Nocardia sp. CDC186]
MRTRFAISCAGIAVGVVSALTLSACSGSNDDGRPSVVASTDVWGDIAAAVAGPDAAVRALITDPSADPHSHETSAVESAALSDADLVVYNGGGYDEFAEKAVAGTGKRTVDAFALRADQGDDNEHVWYDVRTVDVVADRIAAQLGELDPDKAAAYAERATTFKNRLAAVTAITGKLAAEHPRTPVLQTEPLAHYLVAAAGADDLTPHEFQEAIEQETDPAPAAVAATQDLLTGKRVRALIYNVQTEDKITKDLRGTAQHAGVAVVEVTETLPDGVDYIQWQTKNAQALAAALG